MSSTPNTPDVPKFSPDVVVDEVEFEIKARRGRPPKVGPNAPKGTRKVSKAQWFCSADPEDPRVSAFAVALRKLRLQKDWSQTEAGEKCGMTQTLISNLETAQIEPLPAKVFEIEMAFGVERGTLSRHLGYSPGQPDLRATIERVAEELDDLLVFGRLAVEDVLFRDKNAVEVQMFLDLTEKVGLDVIAALAKVSNDLVEMLNTAVDHAMPKALRMKMAEMRKLKRIITVSDPDYPEFDEDETEINGHKPSVPDPEAQRQFDLGLIDSPFDEPLNMTRMDDEPF